MLTRPGARQARGAADRRRQPAARGGLMRFKNPQTARGVVGGGTASPTSYLQIRLGGDLALFAGRRTAAARGRRPAPARVLDRAVHRRAHERFRGVRASTSRARPDDLLRATGLSGAVERAGGEVLAAEVGSSSAGRWASPSTRTPSPPSGSSSTCCCCRATSASPGAGVCPVRGHSNVQGDRTMGIWEQLPAEFLDALGAEFGSPPALPWLSSSYCSSSVTS